MSVKVLVTVELHGMYEMHRGDLDVEMVKRKWMKFPSSTTTNAYCVEFPELSSEKDAVASAEADIAEAVQAAGIYNWDAVCMVDGSETEEDGEQ